MNRSSDSVSGSDDLDRFIAYLRAETHAPQLRHSALLAGYSYGEPVTLRVLVAAFVGMQMMSSDLSSGLISCVIKHLVSSRDEDLERMTVTIINGTALTVVSAPSTDQTVTVYAYDTETLKPLQQLPSVVFHTLTYYMEPVVRTVREFLDPSSSATQET